MRTFGIHPTILPGGTGPRKASGAACEQASPKSSSPDIQVLNPASTDQIERRFSNKSIDAANAQAPVIAAGATSEHNSATVSSDHESHLVPTARSTSHSTALCDPLDPLVIDLHTTLAKAERCLASSRVTKALSIASSILDHPTTLHRNILDTAHLIKCRALAQLGEWARALVACQQALAFSPSSHELLHITGKVLLECGKPTDALACFGYAIDAKPDHLPSWLARGLTYHLHLKDSAHAVSDFHTSIVLNPLYYKSFFYMGMVMTDLQRLDLALEAFSRSIDLNASFSESYFRRGILHLQQQQLEKAIDDFLVVTKLVPESAEALYNCALAQHLLKRNEEAIASYKACLQYQPKYVNALKNCAHAQSEIGMYPEAFENYSTALTIAHLDDNTKLDILVARGQVSERNGDTEQAISDYTAAIGLRPTLARAFTYRGLLRLQHLEFTLALGDFTTSIDLEPDNARAWNNRGTALLHLNQLDSALRDFDHAIFLYPTYTKALRNRGKVLYLQHALETALESLDTAAQQHTVYNDPETFILRGAVHHALGNHVRAAKEFSKAPEHQRRRSVRQEQNEMLAWLNLTPSHDHESELP